MPSERGRGREENRKRALLLQDAPPETLGLILPSFSSYFLLLSLLVTPVVSADQGGRPALCQCLLAPSSCGDRGCAR